MYDASTTTDPSVPVQRAVPDATPGLAGPDAGPETNGTPDGPIRFVDADRVAPDTYVLRQIGGEGVAPVAVHINTMVITGEEPVIVDTGASLNREVWLEQVFALVEPEDVRWVYLSHDDVDHVGNVLQVMDRCPNATLVTNWFSVERLSAEMALPVDRMRWVNGGESFVAGDRELVAVVPPVYDSPTTRGLFDRSTGVYWGADAFGSPVTHLVDNILELDPGFFREAYIGQQLMISPWMEWVDPTKFALHLDQVRALQPTAIASCHGVTLRGNQVESGFNLMTELPYHQPFPWPGQAELDAMHAAMAAAHVA
jgi:flavorubredoxin